MAKASSLVIVGFVLGAATMYLFVRANDPDPGRADSASFLPGTDFSLGRRQAPGDLSAADSLAVYRTTAAQSDLGALLSALTTAAARSASPARDVEVDALIARMSELAPARAAIATLSLGLETGFIVEAFVNWAEVDPDAALAELASVENAIAKREVALTLVDIFGDDNSGFDRVTAGMAPHEREGLRIEWLGRRAAFDPVRAFRDAERLFDTDSQRLALLRVGAAWVEQDPISALSQADLLPDPLRSSYRSSVFSEWARLDGAGYLAWLQSVGTPPEEAAAGIHYLTIADPERLIGVIDTLPGEVGRTIRIATLQSLAEADPEAAMARASALPAGSDRDTMLIATAMSVARNDPDAALAWAQSLSPPSPNAVQQVVIAVAQSNPERALDFLDNPPEGVDSNLIASLMVSVVARDPAQAELLASRLVARDNIQDRNALRNLIGNWMRQDPERALEWLLVHDDQVNGSVLGNAAQSMARSDAAAAADYADRIPAEYRSAWITQVAAPYALNDPAAALSWVNQFQGQPFYDAALSAVITGSAQVDPRRAADLVAQASAEVRAGSARQVAQIWASREPAAAARWVAELTDDRIRDGAVGPVVSAWANSDPGAAESWALDLERGNTRDRALNALITRHAASGDPDAAEALLGQVTNAATRRQIEEQVATIYASR